MDTEVDAEIDMSIDPAPPDPENPNIEAEPVPELREPTKKDISLRDFLSKMDDYAPIVRLQPHNSNAKPSCNSNLLPTP